VAVSENPARPFSTEDPLTSRFTGFHAETEGSERGIDSPRSRAALNGLTYIDTSALAKRYLHEAGSDKFDAFLGRMTSVSISRLIVVELHCLLRRRRRNREIDADIERKAAAAFEEDVAHGFLEVHPLEDQHAIRARDLLNRLATLPLRTLDALHLAVATGINAAIIATADDTFAIPAADLQFSVEWFGEAKTNRSEAVQQGSGTEVAQEKTRVKRRLCTRRF
jgi:uncharacterized protein